MSRYLQVSFFRVTGVLALLAFMFAAAASAPSARGQSRQGMVVTSGPTIVADDINTNTTWSLTNSPYLVSAPVKVLASATLTIEPGVEVQFLQDASLQIDGGLSALGSHTQPILFQGSGAAIQWQGLRIVQPAANVALQYATIKQARAGIAIQPAAAVAARVDIAESLFDTNVVGVSINYSGASAGPHVTLRNSLLTNNSVGVAIDSLPNGSGLVKLSSNSFVLNGIGLKAANMALPGLKAERQWWGSAAGPALGDATYCNNDPPPNPVGAPPDVVCGSVDFAPWSTVPAGRIILPNDKDSAITSGIGASALGDDLLAATSAVTLTIPAQSFPETVDLVLAPRVETSSIAGSPTTLSFEISAVANGQEIYQLAPAKKGTLQIDYVAADVAGADIQKLALYRFASSINYWSYFDINAAPDPANHRMLAQIGQISRFRLSAVDFAKNWLALAES